MTESRLFCQLITLYPGLMPSNSSFTRAIPPLHDIADVNQLSRGDSVRLRQYKKFLTDYLNLVNGRQQQVGCQVVRICICVLLLLCAMFCEVCEVICDLIIWYLFY